MRNDISGTVLVIANRRTPKGDFLENCALKLREYPKPRMGLSMTNAQ
jgi:hypothetical protein